MWFVTNKTNCIKLKKFEKEIIIPLFTELLNYKRQSDYSDFVKYLNAKNINNQNDALIYICKRKVNKIKFIDCVNKIISDYTYEQIRWYFYIYLIQNKQIKEKQTSIDFFKIPEPFKMIFIDFFYNKFFSNDKIWSFLDTSSFSRSDFHNNFKNENRLFVCPYCDIDTTLNIGNNQIEHFWPKSQFPFLAMNALNLISSCHSCNMPFEGKGTSVRTPISTPYTKQIGNYVKFIMNISKEQIDISTNLQDISNYVYLLNLKNRYANPQIYNYLLNLGNSLYSNIIQYENNLGKKLTDSELNNYIATAKKHDKKHIPLYFALMSIYNNYDNYILYLHNIKS